MKTEEVDAVLQREDLRLAVQPKAERLDVRLDLLEYLPEQQLVAVDDVEVVHVPAIYEASFIILCARPSRSFFGKTAGFLVLM